MRTLLRTAAVASAILALAACQPSTPSGGGAGEGSSSSSETSITRNVSFVGTIETLGVSIYQQGTHMLELSDGSIVLLESTDVNLNLNTYIGKKVEVRGSVQPTVEAGGTIMRVEEVVVLDGSASSAASQATKMMCGGIAALPCPIGQVCTDDLTDDCDPNAGGADCSGVCVPMGGASSEASSSSKALDASRSAMRSSASSTSTVSSVPSGAVSDAEIELMAKQNYSSPLWTQEYCTSHIGFCVPVHKNWYYKSFGATTSNRWHVEFGMTSPEDLGSGAIVLNLVSGSCASVGGQSGKFATASGDLVGCRDFEDNHFELVGDASLREALTYMLQNITPYKGE